MKNYFIFLFLLISFQSAFSQTEQDDKFYIGASFGTSYALSDFKDTDITNPNAGFADDGTKLDIYGGFFLNDKVTLTGTFRRQSFATQIGGLIDDFNTDNPDSNFSGNTEDWQVYSVLIGAAYKIPVYKKFVLYPRIGIGPMVVNNPGITISSTDTAITQNFSRSSESGFGFGYELGIGLKTDLGKHFTLMPTFTFSGGYTTIRDVESITDSVTVTSNFDAKIQSFNLGMSIAYRFY